MFYVPFYLFIVRFNSDKTDLESTHSSNASSGIDKQVIPPDALYSMKNNAGYISYEAVFNDSKVSFVHFSHVNTFSINLVMVFQLLNPPDDIEMI